MLQLVRLRARFSGHHFEILQGLSAMAFASGCYRQSFPDVGAALRKRLLEVCAQLSLRFHCHAICGAKDFEPRFAGWGYRSQGATVAFHDLQSNERALGLHPLVSILIRTHRRGDFCAKHSDSRQSDLPHNIEAVVVEDGSDQGDAICAEFGDKLRLVSASSPERGDLLRTTWLWRKAQGVVVLDDDDQFFADHVGFSSIP